MARPWLDEQERRARTVGVRVTAAEAALDGGLPPPPGAGAAVRMAAALRALNRSG